jgi:hypothetical protein
MILSLSILVWGFWNVVKLHSGPATVTGDESGKKSVAKKQALVSHYGVCKGLTGFCGYLVRRHRK